MSPAIVKWMDYMKKYFGYMSGETFLWEKWERLAERERGS